MLVRASTRGDGVVGEDATANVKGHQAHSKDLENAPEHLEVRGEVYMSHDAFQHLCVGTGNYRRTLQNPVMLPQGLCVEGFCKITGSRGLSICFQRPAGAGADQLLPKA